MPFLQQLPHIKLILHTLTPPAVNTLRVMAASLGDRKMRMWQRAQKKYVDENIKTRLLYAAYAFFDRDREPR